MLPINHQTAWALLDGALAPDLTNEPSPEAGWYRSGLSCPVPAGHTPEPGELVEVTLTYSEMPPPPPELDPEPEPDPEPAEEPTP